MNIKNKQQVQIILLELIERYKHDKTKKKKMEECIDMLDQTLNEDVSVTKGEDRFGNDLFAILDKNYKLLYCVGGYKR